MVKKKKTEKMKVLEALLKDLDLTEKVIMDNKVGFDYRGSKYRVRTAQTGEIAEAETKKNEEYMRLLRDGKYFTKKQLIELYKKKGIDIGKIDEEFVNLQEKIDEQMIKFAKIPSKDKKALEFVREKIVELKDEQILNNRKKVEYLQYSIENTIEHFWYSYLTYLITEKLENNKWIRCWKNYEEFKKSDAELSGKAIICASKLLMGLRVPELM